MAAPKETDAKKLCEIAINAVSNKISLKFPQYSQLGSIFKAHCVEEAFEEIDILIDDVAEGFGESVILESVFEDIEIKDSEKEAVCTAIHYTLSNFSPPPTSLNLVEIGMNVADKEIKSMGNILAKQAILLKGADKDKALLKLLTIGQRNHFPLLIYLIDTHSRYRLLEYKKLYKELDQVIGQKNKTRFIGIKAQNADELQTFFKRCYAMKKIKKKSKEDSHFKKVLLWYDSAMKVFFRRLFGPLKMNPIQMVYKINDSILIYTKYYISILIAIHSLLQLPMTKLPQQIDFWVVPKAMRLNINDDEYKDTDDDDDILSSPLSECSTTTEIDNLDKRLKYTDNLVIKDIKDRGISPLSRSFIKIYQNVIKGQRSKRMVIIIDRRVDGKDVIKNDKNYCRLNSDEEKERTDKLYAFLPKQSQNIPSGQYLHEAMFNLSKTEVLPSENGTDNNAIHVMSDLPNMCLLSIHIHQENVVRAYWYINGSFARFYVNDMVNIWPLYFIEKARDQKYDTPIYQDVAPMVHLIKEYSHKLPLKDADFDTFFETNTKIKPSSAYAEGHIQKQ